MDKLKIFLHVLFLKKLIKTAIYKSRRNPKKKGIQNPRNRATKLQEQMEEI